MTTTELDRTTNDHLPAGPVGGVEQSARISFRQPVSTAGFVDAAWWPRSRDLTAELPPLMDVLWTAGREISHITYNMHAWDPAPRRMQIEDRKVRLGGFTVTDPSTVTLSDSWGRDRIDILVVAPETDSAVVQRIFEIASTSEGPYRAEEILERANRATEDPAGRS